MTATPFPLPKSTRQTDWTLGDGGTTYGPFAEGWSIFDEDDVLVETRPAAGGAAVVADVTITKVSSNRLAPFTVTFAQALPATTAFRCTGKRMHRRELAVTRGGQVDGVNLELELSKQAVVQQELRRDIDGLGNQALPDRLDVVEAEIDAFQDGLDTVNSRVDALALDLVNAQIAAGAIVPTSDDLSGYLLVGAAKVVTAVTPGTGELTLAINHELVKGMPVYVAVASGSLAADTIYWVWRDPDVHDKIKLCASYDDAMVLPSGVTLPMIAGTLPTLRIHRDPTQRIVNVLGRKKDGSEGGAFVGPLTGRVTPKMFGAVADAADSSLAYQMAIHWVDTSWQPNPGKWLASLDGECIPYRITRPLNATAITQVGCTMVNMHFLAACAGRVAFDWSGSNEMNLSGLRIIGDETDVPSVGWLGKRRLVPLSGGGFVANLLAAGSHNITGAYPSGSFTRAAYIMVNTDLVALSDETVENRYNSPTKRVGFWAASSQAELRHFGVVTKSEFVPTPDETYSAASIGTITKVVLRNVNHRSPAAYDIDVLSVDFSATPVKLGFAAGKLADAGITGDTLINLALGSNTFNLKRGAYTLKGVTATTGDLYSEDGTTPVSHLTGSHTGGAVAGAYTPNSLRITDRQKAALLFCGPMAEVEWDGYDLGYGEAGVEVDLTEGDIDTLRIRTHVESGEMHTLLLTNIGATPRKLGAFSFYNSGDLTGYGVVHKPFGQGPITIDGEIEVSANQIATQPVVTNWGTRMFSGDVANLFVDARVRTTLTDLMLNIDDMGLAILDVTDAKTGIRTRYPVSHYETDKVKQMLLSDDAGPLGTAAGVADQCDLIPFIMPRTLTIDSMSVRVTTGVAAAQGKLVVYKLDMKGRPKKLLTESAPLDFSTTGTKTHSVELTFIQGGRYWFGVRHSGTATISMLPDNASPTLSSAAIPSGNPNKKLQRSIPFANAAPDPWGWDAVEETVGPVPAIWISEKT